MKDDQAIEPPDASALHLLHRAGQVADELFAINLGHSDLTARQFAVLKSVASTEDMSQTALVDTTGIDRSTLADIVRRLVERGLLQRRRTKRDARMYAVRTMAAGREALRAAEPAARAADERLLSALSPGHRGAFVAALTAIVRANAEAAELRGGNQA